MKNYEGNIENVDKSSKYVFDFLSDFKHFENFLPEQISDWEVGEDYCKFSIQGIGALKLIFKERTPYSSIIIQPSSESNFPVPFFIKAFINQNSDDTNKSSFQFIVEAEINPMIAMMVDKPLKQFVEVITIRLKEYINDAN